jgi:hypothetical protein
MNAYLRPLMKLAVLSVLAFAPGALAAPSCDDVCGERTPCDTGCRHWAIGNTTCGAAGMDGSIEPLAGSQVSMSEQQASSEEPSRACHGPHGGGGVV